MKTQSVVKIFEHISKHIKLGISVAVLLIAGMYPSNKLGFQLTNDSLKLKPVFQLDFSSYIPILVHHRTLRQFAGCFHV